MTVIGVALCLGVGFAVGHGVARAMAREGLPTIRHAIYLLHWWAEDESDDAEVLEMIQQSKECADALEALTR